MIEEEKRIFGVPRSEASKMEERKKMKIREKVIGRVGRCTIKKQ